MQQGKYTQKPLYYPFYPSRIAISATKAVILGVCFEVIDDQEDFDINNKETQKKIVDNTKSLLFRDIVISTTERVIEHVIVSHTDEHFNHKLFKSVRQSALSKEKRMSRGEAAKAMFWTSVRAGFVYHTALLIFEEMYLVFRWISQTYFKRPTTAQLEDDKENKRKSKRSLIVTPSVFMKYSLRNVLVCIAAIIAEGAGAVVGTLLSPGMGSLIGSRIGSLLPYYV